MAPKSSMLRRFFLVSFGCLALLLISQVSQAQERDLKATGFSPEKLEKISAVIKEAVDKKQIAGASVLIGRRGKIAYQTAVGMQDAEAGTPLSENTIFRIASMSKPITSVAAMILIEDGKLKPTDLLSKFAPEFKEMQVLVPDKEGKSYELVKANREITIHDLLTHTSGITYRLINKPFLSDLYAKAGVSDGIVETAGTLGDNVRKIAKLPLACQPGEAWEYGLNTDVLGHVIEVASGKSLEEFCRERIFQPLKMNDTCFVLPKEKQDRLTALYRLGDDKKISRVGTEPVTSGNFVYSATYPTHEDYRYYSGGAGLVSTQRDYFRFCQMILSRGELDGVRVLKAETAAQTTQNQIGKLQIQFPGFDAFGYGFGILTEKGKEQTKDPCGVGSYAWAGAFGTYFWVDPKNEMIVVFMTQVSPPDFSIIDNVKRLTYEAMTDAK
jgi:CubicO group peptidase (beta-lactamase class C family)